MNVRIKVNGKNYKCRKTLDAANSLQLNQEIKYLMICHKKFCINNCIVFYDKILDNEYHAQISMYLITYLPVPVAARSKA